MDSSSVAQLQPITREFLRNFYKDYPIEPLGIDVLAIRPRLETEIETLQASKRLINPSLQALTMGPPKHMDHNMYINRWQCEEIEVVASAISSSREKTKTKSINKEGSGMGWRPLQKENSASGPTLLKKESSGSGPKSIPKEPSGIGQGFQQMAIQENSLEHKMSAKAPTSPRTRVGLPKESVTAIKDSAIRIRQRFELFQNAQKEHVNKLVGQFLPNDFRVTLLSMAREHKEAKYTAQLDVLRDNNGTIAEKYELLWNQQWERRQSLADMGTSSGIWKAVMKYIAGVPQVLLDFAGQINAPLGPTEEMRILYGPHLYEFSRTSNAMHITIRAIQAVLMDASASAVEVDHCFQVLVQLAADLQLVEKETSKYLDFMSIIVEKSPVFVSADALAVASANSTSEHEEPFIDVGVAARSLEKIKIDNIALFHMPGPDVGEKSPDVAAISNAEYIMYYQVSSNRDIDFGIVYDEKQSSDHWIVPKARCCQRGAHKIGSVPWPSNNILHVHLVFDNSYSLLTRKSIQYRVCILPKENKLPSWVKELKDAGYL